MLFKANETWPAMTEDCGHDLVHPASVVSFLYFKVYPLLAYSRKMSKLPYFFIQGWTKKAERIQCPAPLPEEPAILLLKKMLVPAPYQAPEKKAKEIRSGLRRKGTSDVMFEDVETHSSPTEDDNEEEESNSPSEGGGKKRAASTHLEAEASKKGKASAADNPTWDIDSSFEWSPRISPWPNRKYSKTHSNIPLLYFIVLTC